MTLRNDSHWADMIVSTAICTTVVKDAIVAIRTACWSLIEEPAHHTWLPPLALAIWLRASHLWFGCTPSSFSQVLLLTGGWKLPLCWAIKRVIQHPAARKTGKKLPGILLLPCLGSCCTHLPPGLPVVLKPCHASHALLQLQDCMHMGNHWRD